MINQLKNILPIKQKPKITKRDWDFLELQARKKSPHLIYAGTYQYAPNPKNPGPKFPFFISSDKKLEDINNEEFVAIMTSFGYINENMFRSLEQNEIDLKSQLACIKFAKKSPNFDDKNSAQDMYIGIYKKIDNYGRKHLNGVFGSNYYNSDDFLKRGIFNIWELHK